MRALTGRGQIPGPLRDLARIRMVAGSATTLWFAFRRHYAGGLGVL